MSPKYLRRSYLAVILLCLGATIGYAVGEKMKASNTFTVFMLGLAAGFYLLMITERK